MMRIGVDLQALQTESSRNRGVGVYLRNQIEALGRLDHRSSYVCFTSPDLPNTDRLALPRQASVVEYNLHSSSVPIARGGQLDRDERFKFTTLVQSLVLEHDLDLFHLTNPFEWDGFVAQRFDFVPLVVTVYDLIPLVFPEVYLSSRSPDFQDRYVQRLEPILRADRIMAISESTRSDIVRLLSVPEDRIDVIYAGASEAMRRVEDVDAERRIRRRFRIRDKFILCVGGFNYTKNLMRLLRSFGLVDRTLQGKYQLVVVCRLLPTEEAQLREMCHKLRLSEDRVVFTNYVSEDDLVVLYNTASLFVYPSLYDGFGLPVLEAMQCGLPIVTSNVSSLPEVAGEAGWLVDPYDPQAIAGGVVEVLSDPELQQEMREKSLIQATRFSWERSAQATLKAYEQATRCSRRPSQVRLYCSAERRRRIAYFSPMNPQRSGISDYSEELLPHLAHYVDVDLFVDGYQPSSDQVVNDFRAYDSRVYPELREYREYDLVLYQMGNSAFHEYMYDMLLRYPGLIVLHDYILHGLVLHMTWAKGHKRAYLKEVEYCEGRRARREIGESLKSGSPDVFSYPLNRRVVEAGKGIIVHSVWAQRELQNASHHVPPLRVIPHGANVREVDGRSRRQIRQRLGIPDTDFIVGAFGRIANTKRAHVVVKAFARLLGTCPDASLVFVGELSPSLQQSIPDLVRQCGIQTRVLITGYVDMPVFDSYLSAVDVCVNLRYPTAGETSGSLIKALASGKPTIVSRVGQFVEIPDSCCWKVDLDRNEEELLVAYLQELAGNESLRHKMGQNALSYARGNLRWEKVASQYAEFIEQLADRSTSDRQRAGANSYSSPCGISGK